MTPEEAEDIKRHFNVVAEGLRSEIRLVAEGHAGLDQKIDGVRRELQEFRSEARSELRVVAEGLRSEIRLVAKGHAVLDQRIDGVRRELEKFRGEARSEIRLVAEGQKTLRQEAADFRQEVRGEFRDVRKLVEREVVSLKTRLEDTEGRRS